MLVAAWLISWPLAFAAAFWIGPRTGRRYDALVLTGILGVLGLLVLAAAMALDARQERARG